ncbi:MAG: DUF1997 domain-containing protein [Candidatus Sericytochromatia bacterium]|nr:DUF1997 domain-containing protein [Candidatus Tanganyikabacteria bacterium]
MPVMLALEGSLTRDRILPTTVDRCLDLFGDLAGMLARVPAVSSVDPFAPDHCRVILKPLGALDYHLWLATDLQMVRTDDTVTLQSLAFDPEDPWIGEGVLLYRYASTTRMSEVDGGTRVLHEVSVRLDVPLPAFLQKMPLGIVKSAADAVMTSKLKELVLQLERCADDELARKP